MQITDLHMDPLYEEGANTDCGEPLCCQSDQGQASDSEKGAGKWGDYRDCDMPYYALDNFIDQIKTHNVRRLGTIWAKSYKLTEFL